MADIPDFLVLTVAGIFFVITLIVGVCLYYHFFKLRNDSGQGSRRKRESFKLNCGIVNPFGFYMMGTAPVEINGPPPFTIEVNDENKSTSRCVLEEHPLKLSDKMPVCRSVSYEKPYRSPCHHLQVIQETEEEDGDEAEEVNNDRKF